LAAAQSVTATTIVQEIRYDAPEMGEVFLVWLPYETGLEEALRLNPGSRLDDSLLYTPMQHREGSFTAIIELPGPEEVYYCFYNLRTAAGAMLDYWDLSAETTARLSGDRVWSAAYSPPSPANTGSRTPEYYGAYVLAGLLVVALLAYLWSRRSQQESRPVALILCQGIALAAVHLYARADILNVSPRLLLDFPVAWGSGLLGASLEDALFITALTLCFAGLARLFAASGARLCASAFAVVSVVLAAVALLNVDMVAFTGRPFTYSWLVYSEFLTGTAGREAVAATISPARAWDTACYALSVLPLGIILYVALPTIAARKWVVPVAFGLLLLYPAGAWTGRQLRTGRPTPGAEENAIVTFAKTTATYYFGEPGLFSLGVPAEQFPFRERQVDRPEPAYRSHDSVRNVVLVVLESVGAHYLDDYGGGYGIMPNLTALSERSLRFTQAYAYVPFTHFTLASLLLSAYPSPSPDGLTLREEQYTDRPLPAVLGDAGYRTDLLTSADYAFHGAEAFARRSGFGRVRDYRELECQTHFTLEQSEYTEGNGVADNCLTGELFDWIDGKDDDRPFFSMLWTLQAHYPYYVEEERDYGVGDLSFNRYLNAVREDDRLIGRVVTGLRKRGLDSTTLIVVTGDHGEAFGQHGQSGHGNGVYEESMHVPLYFINPLLFTGGSSDDLVGPKDIAPTILSALGIDPPAEWQGRDLLRTDASEIVYYSPWADYLFGYRKDEYKYVFNETRNTVSVYNLNHDPLEQNDLSETMPSGRIDSARVRLAAWAQTQVEVHGQNE
jgi:arylsulfatase A-like enzyme